MSIISEFQFRRFAEDKMGYVGLRGAVNENRTFSKSNSKTSVFLSHAHRDKDKVEQAKIFFENLGISVYVDWMDSSMPESTNGHTANNIKKKIKENERFVLLATNRAVNSKWCNWEVGIGDIFKLASDKIAILGLSDNRGNWEGNEYLQIYPTIEFQNGRNKNNKGGYISEGYYVMYPPDREGSRRYAPIKKWLEN